MSYSMHENIQHEIDRIFEEIVNDRWNLLTDRDFKKLVETINYKFHGEDLILSTLSKKELLQKLDLVTRVLTHCKLDKGAKHYVFTNLYKIRKGLDSESRKNIFKDRDLIFSVELNIRNIYVEMRFKYFKDVPILLLKHKYGENSICNLIEQVLSTIQCEYFDDLGIHISNDNFKIFSAEPSYVNGLVYDEIFIDEKLKNPKWETVDENVFEKYWSQIKDSKIDSDGIFLPSDNSLNAYKFVIELISKAKNSLFIVDPYINEEVIDLIDKIPPFIQVRILTMDIKDSDKHSKNEFKDITSMAYYRKLRSDRGNLEVKKIPNNHDRYLIIDEQKVYLLGSSLNYLGKKSSTILPIKEDNLIKEIVKYYNSEWIKLPLLK